MNALRTLLTGWVAEARLCLQLVDSLLGDDAVASNNNTALLTAVSSHRTTVAVLLAVIVQLVVHGRALLAAADLVQVYELAKACSPWSAAWLLDMLRLLADTVPSEAASFIGDVLLAFVQTIVCRQPLMRAQASNLSAELIALLTTVINAPSSLPALARVPLPLHVRRGLLLTLVAHSDSARDAVYANTTTLEGCMLLQSYFEDMLALPPLTTTDVKANRMLGDTCAVLDHTLALYTARARGAIRRYIQQLVALAPSQVRIR